MTNYFKNFNFSFIENLKHFFIFNIIPYFNIFLHFKTFKIQKLNLFKKKFDLIFYFQEKNYFFLFYKLFVTF